MENVENAKIDEQRPFIFAENDQKRNFEGGGLNLIISTPGTMASTPPRLVGTIYEHFAMLQWLLRSIVTLKQVADNSFNNEFPLIAG